MPTHRACPDCFGFRGGPRGKLGIGALSAEGRRANCAAGVLVDVVRTHWARITRVSWHARYHEWLLCETRIDRRELSWTHTIAVWIDRRVTNLSVHWKCLLSLHVARTSILLALKLLLLLLRSSQHCGVDERRSSLSRIAHRWRCSVRIQGRNSLLRRVIEIVLRCYAWGALGESSGHGGHVERLLSILADTLWA